MKRKGLLCLPALAVLLLAGCSDDAGVCSEPPVSNTARRPAFVGVRLARLEFLAADNPELLVDDVVCDIRGDSVAECWVPHVMDGKRLVPRFTIESADSLYTQVRLFADDMEMGSGTTAVDFARPVTLTIIGGTDDSLQRREIAFGNVDYNDNYDAEGFWVRRQAWFDRLFWDPAFRARVKERFAWFYDHRNDILAGINANAMYLRRSVAENDNRWGVLYQPTWPNRDVWGCYENEVQYMKQWLMRRMEWLRAEFEKM